MGQAWAADDARLTRIPDALPFAVAVLRADDGLILYGNARLQDLLGDGEDVVGRRLDAVVAEPGTYAAIAAAAGGAGGHAIEICGQRANGTPVWMIASATAFAVRDQEPALLATFRPAGGGGASEDDAGGSTKNVGRATDESAGGPSAQAAALALLAELPEKNPGPVCRLERDGTVLMANAAARAFVGVTDPRGRSWVDLCPGMTPELWQRVLHSDDRVNHVAERAGVCILFAHVRSASGDVVFAYGADITARREDEKLLAEQAARLAEVARFPEMNPGPVLRMDVEGKVLMANAAARGVFGAELVGRSWPDLCPGIDEQVWSRILTATGVVPSELHLDAHDYVFAHRYDPATRLVFAFGADVTAQKQAERALRQSEKMATLGTLAAGVAHELNNPAAATRRAAEQLRDAFTRLEAAHFLLEATALTAPERELLAALEQQAREHAARPSGLGTMERSDREAAVEDWLDENDVPEPWDLAPPLVAQGLDDAALERLAETFPGDRLPAALAWAANAFRVHVLSHEIGQGSSRISEIVAALKSYSYLGQAPVQAVDLHEGLDNTLVILRNKLKVGIEVHRDYGPDVPPVPAYGSELNQVWTNLLDNAADAMGGKGEITIRTRRDGAWVVVDICDNGPGIPEHVQSQVFDPFFTTKAPGKGTGLGLSTSYSIITEKHKGTISVESRPGFTRFRVRLPIDPPAPVPTAGDER